MMMISAPDLLASLMKNRLLPRGVGVILLALSLLAGVPALCRGATLSATLQVDSEDLVRFGQDVVVQAEESVPNVAVFYGDTQIDGEVRENVFVFRGNLKLNGKVHGGAVVILGDIDIGTNAVLQGEAAVFGGALRVDPSAQVGRRQHVYSLERFPVIHGFMEWVSHGVLYLRPLPPGVAWVWFVPAAFLMAYAFLQLLLPAQAGRCASVLAERPVASFGVGLMASVITLLAMLVSLLLGAVGIGFLMLAALFFTVLFARMVLVQFIGMQVGRRVSSPFLQRPMVALVIGTLLLCCLYSVPVLGFLVWAGSFPLAIGGVVLTLLLGFRSPAEPKTAAAPPPSMQPVSDTDSTHAQPPPPAIDLPRPAGFFIRLVGTLIDFVLILVVAGMLGIQGRPLLLCWIAYHVLCWNRLGATLGGRVVGIQLTEYDGGRVGIQTCVIRSLAAFLSAIPLFLGFLWAGWDLRKQSWHDKLTGTRVVWRAKALSPRP